jgi:hypothetical protein
MRDENEFSKQILNPPLIQSVLFTSVSCFSIQPLSLKELAIGC